MDRERAIDILYGMKTDNLNLDDLYTKDKYDALEMALKALEQQVICPSAGIDCVDCPAYTPQQKWIPTCERLPEEKDMGWFLVTRVLPNQLPTVEKAYYIYITEYERNWLIEEYTYDCKSPYITAWMPLPQPYKQEEGAE